jgi:hypothetical protein
MSVQLDRCCCLLRGQTWAGGLKLRRPTLSESKVLGMGARLAVRFMLIGIVICDRIAGRRIFEQRAKKIEHVHRWEYQPFSLQCQWNRSAANGAVSSDELQPGVAVAAGTVATGPQYGDGCRCVGGHADQAVAGVGEQRQTGSGAGADKRTSDVCYGSRACLW